MGVSVPVLRSERARGIAELFVAALLFALMAYAAKKATRTIAAPQVVFVRFAVGVAVTALVAAARRAPPRVVRGDLLLLRGLFGGAAVLLYFVGIERLPVGTATLYNYTAPVFTATFSAVFLREALSRNNVLAMTTACAGIVLVVVGQGRALGGAYQWQILALSSAVMSGAALTSIRAARRTDGPWEVFGAFCLVGLVVVSPFALRAWRWPSATEWQPLLAVGLLAAAAQVLMTHALLVVSAATAGIISQMTVASALALGHFLDGEPVSGLALVGAALTVAGASAAARGPLPKHAVYGPASAR